MKKLIACLFGLILSMPAFAALPSGYTELEYIEGTGTQYIDTGKDFASNIKLYMETMYLSPLSTYGWGRNAGSQEVLWQNNMFYFGGGYSSTSQRVIDTKYAYDLDFTAGAMVAKINGAVVRETTNTYNASVANRIYLFALNSYGNDIDKYSGRVYGFKYINGSTLEQNLVPARRNSDNEVGMYDTVSGRFFTNQGTGTFTGGNPVATNCENLFDMSQTPTDEYVDGGGVWQRYNVSIDSGQGVWTTRHATLTPGTYTITDSSGSTVFYYIYDGTSVTRKTDDRTFTLTIPSEVWRFWATPQAAANASEIIIKPESCGTCTGRLVTYTTATGTVTQNGTPTPENPITPTFYTQGNMVLRKVGDIADSYDASTGKITRRVGVKVFDGTEDWSPSSLNTRVLIAGARDAWNAVSSKPFFATISTGLASSSTNPNTCFFSSDFVMNFAEQVNIQNWKSYLAEQYAAGTPVTVWYPLATATTEDWAVTRCETGIKIATTKYNTNAFSSVVTALSNAVDTIKTVVANTINQATAVANLQSGKQTMPDSTATNGTCPNYKQCLLVEDADGTPHWYEIVESALGVLSTGYTALEYVAGTGNGYIDTGILFDSGSLKFEAEVYWTEPLASGVEEDFIGNYVNNSRGFVAGLWSTDKAFLYSPSQNVNTTCAVGEWRTFTGEFSNDTMTMNYDNQELSAERNKYTTNQNVVLFAGNTSKYEIASSKTRLRNVKIWRDGELVRWFLPARRNSDNRIGMYDSVSGQFFDNTVSSEVNLGAGPVAQ